MKSTQKPVTNINGKVRLGWFIHTLVYQLDIRILDAVKVDYLVGGK